MIYSHSRLGTFENCPRQFAFEYLEDPGIERRDSIEAFMGSRVHDALEMVYTNVGMERTPKWDEVERYYNDEWARQYTDRVRIVNPEYSARDFQNVGRRCLREYFFRYFPFRQGRVVGLEERLLFSLDGDDRYRVQGYIDRLVDNGDGFWTIHDYKTNRRVPTQEQIDQYRQLALYQIGVQKRWPEVKRVTLVWHFLRANREMKTSPSPERLEAVKAEVTGLIDTIETRKATGEFPPRESMLCGWCDYQSICPAKRHAVTVGPMSPDEYDADAGVQLADRFIQAKAELGEAKAAVERVRDEVVAYADQQELTVVNGHDMRVSISRTSDMTLPTKKDAPEKRRELEAAILSSGRWDKVSELSKTKLKSALKDATFDGGMRESVAKLLIEKTQTTVRTGRIKPARDDAPGDCLG